MENAILFYVALQTIYTLFAVWRDLVQVKELKSRAVMSENMRRLQSENLGLQEDLRRIYNAMERKDASTQ